METETTKVSAPFLLQAIGLPPKGSAMLVTKTRSLQSNAPIHARRSASDVQEEALSMLSMLIESDADAAPDTEGLAALARDSADLVPSSVLLTTAKWLTVSAQCERKHHVGAAVPISEMGTTTICYYRDQRLVAQISCADLGVPTQWVHLLDRLAIETGEIVPGLFSLAAEAAEAATPGCTEGSAFGFAMGMRRG